ncbi:conserved hypothetical protein [delta proteobacterium NaphS2]|nr:conserved hypothetical protein [delta proteobacterium NaphS2]
MEKPWGRRFRDGWPWSLNNFLASRSEKKRKGGDHRLTAAVYSGGLDNLSFTII